MKKPTLLSEDSSTDDAPGARADITRRDFLGATLLGSGAALLDARCPAATQEIGPTWTGYGGVGDYRQSNGNTADVVRSAHRIRNGAYDGKLGDVIDTGESYDAVIVGAGFAGMAALYEFSKAKPAGKCLVLDNHPIFGGEAKQNEFDVDGYRLVAPQGSNAFSSFMLDPQPDPALPEAYRLGHRYWRELGLPERFEFAQLVRGNSAIAFGQDNFDAMYSDGSATVGYFFQNPLTQGRPVCIQNIWDDDLKRAPLPERVKKDLLTWRDYKGPQHASEQSRRDWDRRLDGMTLKQFVTEVIGLTPEVLSYADPVLASGISAATAEGMSAYATQGMSWIGLRENPRSISFPGGNTTLLRHLVKAVFPGAITGQRRFADIANGSVNFAVLDRQDSNLRMRSRATAVRIEHQGDPASARHVRIVYEKGGRLFQLQAKGVVLATGSWVARHIASDVPLEYQDALASIPHGPILSVNVALHNWRFLDEMGISAARWFDGFGFFANVRRPMLVGNHRTPFEPNKPAVFTFYIPFLKYGLPVEAQGPAGRAELYATSYGEFERKIVSQMHRLFGEAGFDAHRDIAGIILNRWGHALFTPAPGFYFGTGGKPSPLEVLCKRFGRVSFGHSELGGLMTQTWEAAVAEGRRAVLQILEIL